jgi:metal-responsive CopG/Arc/MetJ family transcriptional regulator
MRMHIEMEKELVERLDAVVGERGRSQFVRRAVEAALDQHERNEKIFAARGLVSATDHEWDADPADWVRRQRHGDRRRVG